MRRLRFTIGSLLGVVLFVAVAFAALREATDLWDGGVFSLTLLTLLSAVLLAIHCTDRKQAFWLGFSLFGWVHLGASLVPPVESRLLTTKGLAYVDSKLSDRVIAVTFSVTTPGGIMTTGRAVQALAFSPDGKTLAVKSPGAVRLWNVTTGRPLAGPNGSTENFIRIGHSLIALVMGFFGGSLSRCLYDRGRGPGEVSAGSAEGPTVGGTPGRQEG
jgi:hypothetical protein